MEEAKGRTEEQKIMQEPLKVILGGKECEVKPLCIRDSRLWRSKVAKVLSELPKYISVTSDNQESFEKALDALIGKLPDAVVDLFFDYAKDLNREEIEGIATDFELSKAFQEVMRYAFPLAQSLTQMLGKLRQ